MTNITPFHSQKCLVPCLIKYRITLLSRKEHRCYGIIVQTDGWHPGPVGHTDTHSGNSTVSLSRVHELMPPSLRPDSHSPLVFFNFSWGQSRDAVGMGLVLEVI